MMNQDIKWRMEMFARGLNRLVTTTGLEIVSSNYGERMIVLTPEGADYFIVNDGEGAYFIPDEPVRQCAVCGDTEPVNVLKLWQRTSDGKQFNICMACAEEPGQVNEESVENFGEARNVILVKDRGRNKTCPGILKKGCIDCSCKDCMFTCENCPVKYCVPVDISGELISSEEE